MNVGLAAGLLTIASQVATGVAGLTAGQPDVFKLAVLWQSTSPYLALVTIVDDRTGTSRLECLEAGFIVEAVGRQQDADRSWNDDATAEEIVLNNTSQTFHFSSPWALRNVRPFYTVAQVAAARAYLAHYSNIELEARLWEGDSSVSAVTDPATQSDAAGWATAQALMERGYLVEDADFGGLRVVSPQRAASTYASVADRWQRGTAERARGRAMIRRIPGYDEMIRRFIPSGSVLRTGDGTHGGLSVELHRRSRSTIDTYSWVDPVDRAGARYSWHASIEAADDADRAASQQDWLVRWKQSGAITEIDVQIPPDAASIAGEVVSAWRKADLPARPYYDFLVETEEEIDSVYLDRSGRRALIDRCGDDDPWPLAKLDPRVAFRRIPGTDGCYTVRDR
jgi:hypothetical protein